jgi:hypothetical protein
MESNRRLIEMLVENYEGLAPVIPAIWEAEIQWIVICGQSGQIVCKTSSPK